MSTAQWLLVVFLEAVLAAVALAWREKTHDRERKDLLDRLMAKDYSEYHESRQPAAPGGVRNWLRRETEKHGIGQKLPGPEEEPE